MATRKLILDYIETTIRAGVPTAKTVERRLVDRAQLMQFAVTQLPVVCVVGQLPIPRAKESAQEQARVTVNTFEMKVDCYVYLTDNTQSDNIITASLEELWRVLYAPPTPAALALKTSPILHWRLVPEAELGYWEPFVAYVLTVNVTYVNTTGGI
jgi:hypothetical protein